MKYLENSKIKEEAKEILKEQLTEYKDTSCYSCDLAYQLLERYNVDGSYTYNTYEAIEWIKENFEELGEIVEEIKSNLGTESIPNVFDRPEAFQVVIFLEVASYLLNQCKFIDDNWNEEIELNQENIKVIISQLENI